VVAEIDELMREARGRVGARVRGLRHNHAWTQETLAHEAGLATRHLQRIEAAEINVTLETLVRLATVLNVDVAELLAAFP